ncbi:hypothetical protein [Streptomyces sp. NPDC021096]|uniref:hypothetical protein n=1 Tax=Streptomyces sp. NPDC021096 TaxID=3154792 RepID=UPI0033E2D946
MDSSMLGTMECGVPGAAGCFWVVDASTTGPAADDPGLGNGARPFYRAVLWPGTPSVRAAVEAWSGPPPGGGHPYGDPFHCPSGAVALEVGGHRMGEVLPLDGPGVYWCLTSNGMQLSGGDPMTYHPREEDPYAVRLWRVPGQLAAELPLFTRSQPRRIARGAFTVSHGEFWLSARSAGLPDRPPVPDVDAPAGADGVVAIPTMAQDTRVAAVVSWWDGEPPAADGIALGSCQVRTDGGPLRCWSVDGPGDLALAVPGPGRIGVCAWRRVEPGEDFRYERYDVRVWACSGP